MHTEGATANVARSAEVPVPPLELRERVGATTFENPVYERRVRKAPWWDPDPARSWCNQGRHLAETLRDQLPEGVSLRGARVLDFGCGAGRVLRPMLDLVGDGGELHGVDIDGPSIAWLQANASPPLHAATCGEQPGLPYPDDHFDVVYALSVFTHIADEWAGWLIELRRVLKPGGVLLATVICRRTGAELGLVQPESDPSGMYVRALGNGWDQGGPVVIHDPSWIAERWGRAFRIVSHAAQVTGDPWPHDIVAARPGPGAPTVDGLLAAGPDGEADGLARTAQLALMRDDALARRAGSEARERAAVEAIGHARANIEARASARLAELAERYAALEAERATLDAPGARISARALDRLRALAAVDDGRA